MVNASGFERSQLERCNLSRWYRWCSDVDHRHSTRREHRGNLTSSIPVDVFIFQVIKSRIQTAATGTYSGFLDCVRKTIATDGVRALWRGLGPAMARAFPANAAAFVSSINQVLEPFDI